MDGHLSFLRTACRLCGKVLSRKSDFADKSLFKNELLNQFQINIEKDVEEIYPNSICTGCKRSLYRIRGNTVTDVHAKVTTSKRPFNICGQVTLKETVHVIRKPEGVLQKVLKKRLWRKITKVTLRAVRKLKRRREEFLPRIQCTNWKHSIVGQRVGPCMCHGTCWPV